MPEVAEVADQAAARIVPSRGQDPGVIAEVVIRTAVGQTARQKPPTSGLAPGKARGRRLAAFAGVRASIAVHPVQVPPGATHSFSGPFDDILPLGCRSA